PAAHLRRIAHEERDSAGRSAITRGGRLHHRMVGDRGPEVSRPARADRWRRRSASRNLSDCEALVRAVGAAELGQRRDEVSVTWPRWAEAIAPGCTRARR